MTFSSLALDSEMRRREFIASAVGTALASALPSAHAGRFGFGRGFGNAGGFPSRATFDYYISATGDDNNVGSLSSPWSITALNSKGSTYAGKRVGLIGNATGSPTIYQYGTTGGVQTTLYSLYQGLPFTSDGTTYGVINITSGSSGSPTYIGSCNASGLYEPRTVLLNAADPSTGDIPIIAGFLLGQSGGGALGFVTIDGINATNFTFSSFLFYCTQSYPAQQITIQNCELYGAGNIINNNNPGAIWFNNVSDSIIQNVRVHDLACNATVSCTGSLSGTTLTITSVQSGFLQYGMPLDFSGGSIGISSQTSGTTGGAGIYVVSNSGNYSAPSGTVFTAHNLPEGYYPGFIQFNCTTAPSNIVTTSTFENTGGISQKDQLQQMDVSYCYIELDAFGADSENYEGNGCIANYLTSSGTTVKFHHNIVAGALSLIGEASVNSTNEGTVVIDHNTFYGSPNLGWPMSCATGFSVYGSPTGSWQFTNNIVFSDRTTSPQYETGVWNVATMLWGKTAAGAYVITSDYNGYGSNGNGVTFGTDQTSGDYGWDLSTWKTNSGQDVHSIALATTPFSGTPAQAVSSSFAIAGASLTASSTGGPIGALDGTGTVGCNFSAGQ